MIVSFFCRFAASFNK